MAEPKDHQQWRMEGELQFHSHRFWFLAGLNSVCPLEKTIPRCLASGSFSLVLDDTVALDCILNSCCKFVYCSTFRSCASKLTGPP